MPQIASAAITGANKGTKERRRKLRSMVACLIGMEGGPKGDGVPRKVFMLVLDFLMPSWDPLRKHDFAAQLPQA